MFGSCFLEKNPSVGENQQGYCEVQWSGVGRHCRREPCKTSVSVSVCQCVSSDDSVELLDALLGLL